MQVTFHYQYIGGPRDGLTGVGSRLPDNGFTSLIPIPGRRMGHLYRWDAARIAFVYAGVRDWRAWDRPAGECKGRG